MLKIRNYNLSVFFLLLFFFFCSGALAQENTLRFLVLPVEEVNVMFRHFLPLKHHLEEALGCRIELAVAQNYDVALDEIGQGKVDLAYLDPSAYCEARFHYQAVPLVKVDKNQQVHSHSVLVVRHDSPIQKIIEVKGKRLALGNVRSTFSFLAPLAMLKEVELDLSNFQKVGYLQEEDRVALAVLVGDYDVGGLSEEVAQKYLEYGLKIIKTSKAIPQFTICASPRLPLHLRRQIQAALLRYSNKNRCNPCFSPATDQDYDIMRIILRNLTGQNYLVYPPEVVKVALLPLYSTITLYEMFSPLANYLSDQVGVEFKLVIPKDFEEFVQIVREGKVDFAYQNPYVYVLLSRGGYLQALTLTLSNEQKSPQNAFRGVIISRQDSPVKRLADLKKKRIMIVSHKSAGGYWFQKIYLHAQGIDINKEATIIEGKKQEEVIMAVYRKEVDAGFVREAALDVARDIMDIEQIRILAFTPFFPNWPFAVCKNTPSSLAGKAKKALLNLKKENLLEEAGIVGFVEAEDNDFAFLRKWLEKYDKNLSAQD